MRSYPGNMAGEPKSVMWGGRRWFLNGGYYMSRTGSLLHLAVYRAHHGAIPKGHDVHHKDENKANFSPDNLEALTRRDHLKRHRPRGWKAHTPEQRAAKTRAQWDAANPRDVVCARCGRMYQSLGTRARFCSGLCKGRWWRANHPTVNRPRKPARKRPEQRRPDKSCATCGTAFHANDPRTQTCSRKCGAAYRATRFEDRRVRRSLQS